MLSGAMTWIGVFVPVAWGVFWLYWLLSAFGAKQGTRSGRRLPGGLLFVAVYVIARSVHVGSGTVHAEALRVAGVALLVASLAFAVWARVTLGRNWGMPMTAKNEPELVTTGPYRRVRHPIYTGLLFGILGSALATSVLLLIALLAVGPYFFYSARVEERLMTAAFPAAYAGYKRETKMFIPFAL